MVRKFSSTLALRDAEVGGTVGALAAPGGGTENHLLNKFRAGIPLPTAHQNSPSWTVSLGFTKCSEDPKVTGLLSKAEPGIREERYELGKQQSDLMAWNPSHTISQELPPQTQLDRQGDTRESRQGNMHHTGLVHVHLSSPPSPDPAASTSQSHGAHAHLRPSPNTHQPTAQLSLLAFSSALGHSRN